MEFPWPDRLRHRSRHRIHLHWPLRSPGGSRGTLDCLPRLRAHDTWIRRAYSNVHAHQFVTGSIKKETPRCENLLNKLEPSGSPAGGWHHLMTGLLPALDLLFIPLPSCHFLRITDFKSPLTNPNGVSSCPKSIAPNPAVLWAWLRNHVGNHRANQGRVCVQTHSCCGNWRPIAWRRSDLESQP